VFNSSINTIKEQVTMSDKTTVVFLGTPQFSCPFLRELAENDKFEVLGVITQEDKPTGRKKTLTASPVKVTAQELDIPVYQPTRLNKDKALITQLQNLSPEFLVVVAYGQIISKKVLDIPKIAPINVHGSILPKYRGASPIQESILNGDTETGLSIMQMDLSMDTGAVYKVLNQEILLDDNDITLREKLSNRGSEALPDILLDVKTGKLKANPQDEAKATYCEKIDKEDGHIAPKTMTSEEIFNRWRAFIIWPGIFMDFQDKKLKLLEIKISTEESLSTGAFATTKNQIFLGCKNGTIEILKLQLEGKSALNADVFLSGNRQLFSN
jgi:methionyl-tRNA formyltransferase